MLSFVLLAPRHPSSGFHSKPYAYLMVGHRHQYSSMDLITLFHQTLRLLTKPSAISGEFVLIQEVSKWLSTRLPDSGDTHFDRIYAALGPCAVRPDLDLHLKTFCILFQINACHIWDRFVSLGVQDYDLPLSISTLEEFLGMPEKAARLFFDIQWRYCAAHFDLARSNIWQPETVIPVRKKRLIAAGNTAKVSQIAIPEEYLSAELAETLSWARFTDSDENGPVSVSAFCCDWMHSSASRCGMYSWKYDLQSCGPK